jgi:hypothetical protein
MFSKGMTGLLLTLASLAILGAILSVSISQIETTKKNKQSKFKLFIK